MAHRPKHDDVTDVDRDRTHPPDWNGPAKADRGDPTAPTGASIDRREWLTALGTFIAAPAVATETARAEDEGYGTGGYGDGGYGDHVDDDEDETEEERLDVATREATDVSASSAILPGELVELEGLDAATVSIMWGEPGDGFPYVAGKQTLESPGRFDAEVSDLESDTAYEFYAFADAEDGDASDAGETLSFTTEPQEDEEEEDEDDDEEEEEDELEAVSTITELHAEDVSNPRNPHVDAAVEWAATIEEGELAAAKLTISDANGVVFSEEYDLEGRTADHSEEEQIHHGSGETYEVELTVHSAHGTTETDATTLRS